MFDLEKNIRAWSDCLRSQGHFTVTMILGIFAGAAVLINTYPSYPPNSTELLLLAALKEPIKFNKFDGLF